MKLIVYPLTEGELGIRAAPAGRQWMDETPDSFAYRCLPLTIANSHGWEILNPRGFRAIWNGEVAKDAVTLTFDDPGPQTAHVKAMAHFGSGTFTFELPMMFKTPPGWNLMVQGPINRPKDAVAGLAGVIETDWSPYTFTMNWMFTRPDVEVRFEAGEPIAHLFPVRRGTLEKIEPEIRTLHEDKDRLEQNELWRKSRSEFLTALDARAREAVEEKWQKSYYRGKRPDGRDGVKDHKIKLRVKEFTKKS